MEEPYVRKVQYYETDMMGVAHHANFIHWMEEARILFMDRLGFPYAAMEAKGIICHGGKGHHFPRPVAFLRL